MEPEAEPQLSDDLDHRVPLDYLLQFKEDVGIEQLRPGDPSGNEEECELAVYPPMTKTVPDASHLAPNEILVFKSSAKGGTRRAVVQRDVDVLTPDQVKGRWEEVKTARLVELKTWNKLKCFSRKRRDHARNIIDTRWVLKFKWIHPAEVRK